MHSSQPCDWIPEPASNHRPAGADIKEMKDKSCNVHFLPYSAEHLYFPFPVAEAYTSNFLSNWEVISKLNKPVIAAVSGYAVCVNVSLDHFALTIVARWRS